MLARGADPNSCNLNGCSILHFAAGEGGAGLLLLLGEGGRERLGVRGREGERERERERSTRVGVVARPLYVCIYMGAVVCVVLYVWFNICAFICMCMPITYAFIYLFTHTYRGVIFFFCDLNTSQRMHMLNGWAT
jgi:hypothetical protein